MAIFNSHVKLPEGTNKTIWGLSQSTAEIVLSLPVYKCLEGYLKQTNCGLGQIIAKKRYIIFNHERSTTPLGEGFFFYHSSAHSLDHTIAINFEQENFGDYRWSAFYVCHIIYIYTHTWLPETHSCATSRLICGLCGWFSGPCIHVTTHV